jgi:hypothetical protein
MMLLLFSGFTFKDSRIPKYTNKGDYIYNLVKTSEIQIYFIRAPKINEYFGDIKESDYYAGAFINAAVSGILNFPQKRIYPKHWINVANAKLLMDKAYAYKTGQNIKISGAVFGELLSMNKYKRIRDKYYLTKEMQNDIFAIYAKKIEEFKKSKVSPEEGTQEINTSTSGGVELPAGRPVTTRLRKKPPARSPAPAVAPIRTAATVASWVSE